MENQIMQEKIPCRRGGALVMVMIAVGLASVMAVALLSSASLQAQASNNAVRAAQAENLAESGVNLAMFYLQHPEKYSGAMPLGFYPGEANANMGSAAGGTVTTSVTWDAVKDEYLVSSLATVQSDQGATVRRVESRVKPVTSGNFNFVTPTEAMVANGPVLIDAGMTVDAIRATGAVALANGSRVVGNVISNTATKTGVVDVTGSIKTLRQAEDELQATTTVDEATLPLGLGAIIETTFSALFRVAGVATANPPQGTTMVPQPAYVPNLKTYRYKNSITGVVSTYSASYISLASLAGTNIGTTILNPAGIYWTDHQLQLQDVTITGSLLLTSGAQLTIANGVTIMNPRSGYPALVMDGEIDLKNGANLTINGLAYAKRVTSDNNAAGSFIVDGALMLFGDSNLLPSDKYIGTVQLKYNSTRAQVGGFGVAIADTDIRALKVLQWTQK
jgi:hypothetical protein